MNSTLTTNILLAVILLVSIGNYLKTDELESTLINIETLAEEASLPCYLNDVESAIDDVSAQLDTIEFETQMAASACLLNATN